MQETREQTAAFITWRREQYASSGFGLWTVPLVRKRRARNTLMANPVFLVLRVIVLALNLIAWGWGVLVLDQLPCFLGIPNCD